MKGVDTIVYEQIFTLEEFVEHIKNGRTNFSYCEFADDLEINGEVTSECYDLTGFIFNHSVMNGIKFSNTKLNGSLFIATSLFHSEFSDCSAKCCNFNKAILDKSRFERDDFSESTFVETSMNDLKSWNYKDNGLFGSVFDNAEIKAKDTMISRGATIPASLIVLAASVAIYLSVITFY